MSYLETRCSGITMLASAATVAAEAASSQQQHSSAAQQRTEQQKKQQQEEAAHLYTAMLAALRVMRATMLCPMQLLCGQQMNAAV
jgi:hypothetical protein|eukprot:COSAG01_NODE_1502_length_10101_cov_6.907119_9_plen_85_part_00